jgi:para-nitrobenzyl esterase
MTDVVLSTGIVRGTSSAGIRRFLGIPYAAAPVAERRFALPVPHSPWKEIYDATGYGATAPQSEYAGAIGKLLPTVTVPGDEFLNLNVWAPENAQGLPVMFWVHGGSLAHGSNALAAYDGASFARDGVVFVSINYRLGSEGFSVLEGAPLNLGLADVVAALRWVQDEIAAFGGDPSRVTGFGESAGAILLGALLPHPDARSLFSQMILQSGLPAAADREKAGLITRKTAKHLGIPATRAAFAKTPAGELVAAQNAATAGSTPITGGASFTLAVGDELIPSPPMTQLFAGVGGDIPLLLGSTSEEYRLWFVPTGLMSKISAGLFAGARLTFKIGPRVMAAYRDRNPGASRGELFGALATDILLRLPINRIADARLARGASTHVYEFAWRSPVQDLGAAHAMELGFVFDGLASPDSINLAGPDAPQQLADDMHGAWVRFATTGDPGWTAWSAERPVQTFDAPASRIVNAPRERERASWGR